MCIFKYIEGEHYSSTKNLLNLIDYVIRGHGEPTSVNGQGVCSCSSSEVITNNFIYTKKLYNKLDGRWAYHYIISPGAVLNGDKHLTVEEIMGIGQYISETLFSGYQTVYAVHSNTDQLHLHLVVNSVSYVNGMKLHFSKGFIYEAHQKIDNYIRGREEHQIYNMIKTYGYKELVEQLSVV